MKDRLRKAISRLDRAVNPVDDSEPCLDPRKCPPQDVGACCHYYTTVDDQDFFVCTNEREKECYGGTFRKGERCDLGGIFDAKKYYTDKYCRTLYKPGKK